VSGLRLLGEAPGLRIVEKPAGLPVFPPHADPGGDCVLARLRAAGLAAHPGPWPAGFEGGIAHRLDGPTSGLLLVAADPDALAALRQRFASGALRKRYRFLSRRDVPWDAHHTEAPIAHDPRHKGRMVVERGAATPHRGRWLPARTDFRRVGVGLHGLPLWEAEMRTGVMHQVRVHAASLGLALAGDRRYGGGPLPAGFEAEFALHHCAVLGLERPTPPCPPPDWWRAEAPAR
jgi:23S rRNA-/tRNA-specific pseudouridylate synthase